MSNRHRKLRMEQMERRELMAGDIGASVQNGDLVLIEKPGQIGWDNSVQISQIDIGKIRVEGALASDGLLSKVNGKAFEDFDVPGGLSVKFGGGNDTVKFVNGIGLQINLREIKIDVAAPPVTSASLAGTFPGPDTDLVSLTHFHTVGNVSIMTGDDRDTVSMIDALVGDVGATPANVLINTGTGVDSVKISSDKKSPLITGTLDVQTYASLEADRDVVSIDHLGVQRDLHVRTGDGNDSVTMTNVGVMHNLDFDTGAGNDFASLDSVSAVDLLMAKLGNGDDTLNTSNLFTNSLNLDGGNGFDQLFRKADPFLTGQRTQPGWEMINGVSTAINPTINPLPLKPLVTI